MADLLNKENVSPVRRSLSPSKRSSPSKVSRKGRSKSIGPEGILEQQKPIASPNKNRRKSSFAPAPKSILPSEEDVARRREARRKSLANRRVSFAPEATLHTWDVIEYMREATTSSASSGDSRRASRENVDEQLSDPFDVPATPEATSPAQRRKRRSSTIPPLNFNDPDEDFSSSPASGSSPVGDSEEESEDMESILDQEEEDDSDAMSLVSNENTVDMTIRSTTSSGTNESSARLTANLDAATVRAGTQNIDEIINGGNPYEDEDEYEYEEEQIEQENDDIRTAIQQQGMLTPMAKNLIAFQDQENVNPFSPAFRAHAGRPSTIAEETEIDASMDMTRPLGSIMESKQIEASTEDATMDFTQVAGQIYQPSPLKSALKRRRSTADSGSPMVAGSVSQESEMGRAAKRRRSSADRSSAGDGTMDFTTAFGAIAQNQRRDETMEFTTAIGEILRSQSPIKVSRRQSVRRRRSSAQSVTSNDQTMDFTMAVGAIKQAPLSPLRGIPRMIEEEDESMRNDTNEDMSMELTTALGNVMDQQSDIISRPTTPHHLSSPLQDDPPTTPKDQGRFKEASDLSAKKSLTPAFMQEAGVSPLPNSVQIRKSPASAHKMTPVGRASASPFLTTKRASMSPTRTPLSLPNPVNATIRTPSVSPQRSLYPDLGEAKSILTPTPSPGKKAGSTHATPSMPATPVQKSSPIRALSSPFKPELIVKPEQPVNPAQPSPKRSQSNMLETIRTMSTPRKESNGNVSPLKRLKEMTPRKTPLAKARTPRSATTRVQFSAPSPDATSQLNSELLHSLTASRPTEKVTLSNFLSTAGIKFMDLTASKRRYTAAPTPSKRAAFSSIPDEEQDSPTAFVDAVVAGACTVPELDLYVHACRELKRYMSEGRNVLKQLEKEIETDAPPFMAAYLQAKGEQKSKMDMALGEMKAKARMGSKEIWYAWRQELLSGLENGLREIERGLINDEVELDKQEEALRVLEEAVEMKHELAAEVDALEEVVARENLDDKEELSQARRELRRITTTVSEQKTLLAQVQSELEEQERLAELYIDSKTEALAAIEEANRIKEASRGISIDEVASYHSSVLALESSTKWRITTATPTSLTLTFASDLELFFAPSSFLSSSPHSQATNAPISLSYIALTPLTTEKRFILQLLRAQLQMLDQSSTPVRALLSFVARGWELAVSLAETVRRLRLSQPVEVQILSDERMLVEASVLLVGVQTKVLLAFEVEARVLGDGESEGEGEGMRLVVQRECRGRVVYGEMYKEGKMGEFLGQRVGGALEGAEKAVGELRGRLERTGRKG
ncbi:Spc7 kinetochore protein-domain-containing protein [Elsinoe ampelina]|uniref:Spc7 kinetochore protein-domain-containing protein n=1 Tax=Elsinoe ampelina TaxID=302913 RepID=A0A6A6GDD0_9PEZI|nr:Spc7 kinetochore protein-domain-containing protein [Elsinoe ampelina]